MSSSVLNKMTRTSVHRRMMSTNNVAGDKKKLLSLRLYRILQRSCKSLAANIHQGKPILLQPPLEATDWGSHKLFSSPSSSSLADVDSSIEEIFRVFHSWNTSSIKNYYDPIIDDWFYAVAGKKNNNNNTSISSSASCWTTTDDLRAAIKRAFSTTEYYNDDGIASDATRIAILANQAIDEQRRMMESTSSTTTQQINVTATSQCIGMGASVAGAALVPPQHPASALLQSKYRFAYRIRIENLSDQNVQLLGRYWAIQEGSTTAGGGTASSSSSSSSTQSEQPVIVDAPSTGAVGQLPVIKPGQVFEYMSGADLASTMGEMHGHFYMARVPDDAQSAKSGDDVQSIINDSDKFEAIVAPFMMVADR